MTKRSMRTFMMNSTTTTRMKTFRLSVIYALISKQLSTFSLKLKVKINIVALFALTVKYNLIKKPKRNVRIIAVDKFYSQSIFTPSKVSTSLNHAKNAESSS